VKMAFNRAKSISMNISGSGNIELAGTAETAEISISGSGNADCGKLQVDKALAKISGSGNVKIFANQSIKANISGSGNVLYKGAANDIETHSAGSGKVIRSNS
jgi:hypothetical protein